MKVSISEDCTITCFWNITDDRRSTDAERRNTALMKNTDVDSSIIGDSRNIM